MSKASLDRAEGTRVSLKVNDNDNVATLLDDDVKCCRIVGGMAIAENIPFGHKVALADICEGGEVIKYGIVIGHAKSAIAKGEHVHVHNVT
jgi:altronate dehydratase